MKLSQNLHRVDVFFFDFAIFLGLQKVKQVRGSIVVSISACHAEDQGSIPCLGDFQHFQFYLFK